MYNMRAKLLNIGGEARSGSVQLRGGRFPVVVGVVIRMSVHNDDVGQIEVIHAEIALNLLQSTRQRDVLVVLDKDAFVVPGGGSYQYYNDSDVFGKIVSTNKHETAFVCV